jgi:NAD+ synthase (glutamine-hydrolysing)
VYLYANQQGCDGDRLYYDGSCLVILNGEILGQGTQFSLEDVQVVCATVDLESVRSYRGSHAPRNLAASMAPSYPRVRVEFHLSNIDDDFSRKPTQMREAEFLRPEEEIRLGPACWLWDYLRRSGATGYFLPLSGGLDSCSTAMIVHSMCCLVVEGIKAGSKDLS